MQLAAQPSEPFPMATHGTVTLLLLLGVASAIGSGCDRQSSATATTVVTLAAPVTPWTTLARVYDTLPEESRRALASRLEGPDAFQQLSTLPHMRDLSLDELLTLESNWPQPVDYDQPGSIDLPHLSRARVLVRACIIRMLIAAENGDSEDASQWACAALGIITELGRLPTIVERGAAAQLMIEFCSTVRSAGVHKYFSDRALTYLLTHLVVTDKNPFRIDYAIRFMRGGYVRDIEKHPDTLRETPGIDQELLRTSPAAMAAAVNTSMAQATQVWHLADGDSQITSILNDPANAPARPFMMGLPEVWRLKVKCAEEMQLLRNAL
jgi:hypothetical protein